MGTMELLDFSGNTIRQGMTSLSGAASNSRLKTVIVDGCVGLEMISFRDCKELKNLFLKGSLGSLEELDLSGTKVKTLNLGGVQSTLPKRIVLLGCEKLRAILWPESVKNTKWEGMLQIDTTLSLASIERGQLTHAHPYVDQVLQGRREELVWQIFVMDARLLRSVPIQLGYGDTTFLHIDGTNVQGTSSEVVQVQSHTSTRMDSGYRDVLNHDPVEPRMMWECPKIMWREISKGPTRKVIMHVQANKLLEDAHTSALLIPDIICQQAISLHVYDNSSVTSIPRPPQGSKWLKLTWCRVERCPKIHTVFTLSHGGVEFYNLRTFWASQLLSARYISDKPHDNSDYLEFLHVDHCPRLIHVFPLSRPFGTLLSSLKTVQIMYCGDLREVFPLSPDLQEQDKVTELPNLMRIHLHELPSCQHFCGRKMYAPKLETIKIRGCWSLRRLPAIGRNTKPPKVDCEKEWWDDLEWDGLGVNHHPSLYEARHSLYYKAQIPRGSLLR
jgi:hypothetical protein